MKLDDSELCEVVDCFRSVMMASGAPRFGLMPLEKEDFEGESVGCGVCGCDCDCDDDCCMFCSPASLEDIRLFSKLLKMALVRCRRLPLGDAAVVLAVVLVLAVPVELVYVALE